jgi:6-phosphogluconate dehydrogenase
MGNLCEKKGVKFIGMGVSGGEEGARNGPALMIGSKDPINETLQKILSSIAAKKDGIPCVGIYEGFGTGHFIKMLHNGIEYAEMQIIAEAYSVLRSSGFDNIKISNFFESFKEIGQSSYLIEITTKIFQKKNSDGFLIDQIKPLANHKGTGKLTVQTSLDYGYPLSAIYESLNARIESNFKNDWQQEELKMSESLDLNKLQKAVYFSRFATLIQGLLFIQFFSTEHNLNIKISEVLKNWMGGCIIRSDLLSELTDFLNSDSKLEIIQIQNRLSNLVEDAKNIITGCISNNISTPVMSSTLNWYLNMSAEHNPSNLIQAQRDFFGAHTVQLLDSEEFLHLQWD